MTMSSDAAERGPRVTIPRAQLALNPIQWINIKEDPDDPSSDDLWLFADPAFRADYPAVLGKVKAGGFDTVMMQVLDTQTLQDYERMVREAGLRLAPGYCQIGLPEDHGHALARGSAEWVRWFDGIRRAAEESNYFGLETVFLAPEMSWEGAARTVTRSAVGAAFDQGRLDRVVEVLAEAARILTDEGVRPGLHNHVGTWVETEHEIDYVLERIDEALLGASFDVGHLAWAGIDPVAMLARHRDRLVDVHVKDLDLSVAAASRTHPTDYRSTVDRGLFLEPGLGDLDLDGCLAALPEDFGGWIIIEVDRASMDPDESVHVSRRWVERVFPD
jgi:sugar phosphate isomerase/epimerase